MRDSSTLGEVLLAGEKLDERLGDLETWRLRDLVGETRKERLGKMGETK